MPFTTLIHLYQQAEFMTNIHAYNVMFSMTSFGANVDEDVNYGSGPYVYAPLDWFFMPAR
uniref:Uncharacterized protein n=1 Tax=Helianthus annuus TaxID=4232 RepID=A0A251RNC2_HELAN